MSGTESQSQTALRRSGDPDETVCCGMDVPEHGSWTAEDVAFWTGTPHYQPWKDVAAFFKGDVTNDH